jgi:hypothetical protein
VQVAFEIADRALARCVVAERDVHVRVDQARDGRHTAGVDDDIGALGRGRRRCPDHRKAAVLGDDRIAGNERIAPVA